MNTKNHRLIISFVSVTIVATILVQVYWNYLSYQTNKEELINQVQICLDQAVDVYYSEVAQKHTLSVSKNDTLGEKTQIRHLIKNDKHVISDTVNGVNTLQFKTIVGDHVGDSIIKIGKGDWNNISAISMEDSGNFHFNEVDLSTISMFASKIFVSMSGEYLNFDDLAESIKTDFEARKWPISFGLLLRDARCDLQNGMCDPIKVFGDINQEDQLITTSNSAFIADNTVLEIYFSNISSIVLKRSIIGISLSMLLSAAVICCLLYLFKTINEQKQLAEIKNDLISNITHEFKTPITTIGTALEGIENFSGLKDLEKAKKYIGISNWQLSKLNEMVEKLLETASIDSEHLTIKLERINLTQLLKQQLKKYGLENEDMIFNFDSVEHDVFCQLDKYHIESAIGNLVDNAIKYGDGEVFVAIEDNKDAILIQVKDNGFGIAKDQRHKIFDKFYRIPTGNIHDVKGFGIGLYYAKNIIEKHGGKLEIDPTASKTTFNIFLKHAD